MDAGVGAEILLVLSLPGLVPWFPRKVMKTFKASLMGGAIAASLLLSGAATAQTEQGPDAANNALASVTTKEGGGENLVPTAPQAESVQEYEGVVPEYKAFVTAPSMKPNIMNEKAMVDAGYGETRENPLESLAEEYTVPTDLDALAFLLAPDLLPKPLRYENFDFSNVLIVHVPTPAEIKMMLPGDVLDHADTARYRISQYMGDLTGSSAQRRDQQKSTVMEWSRSSKNLYKNLSANPWQKYQFNRMAQAQLQPFKIGIAGQSAREAQLVANQIKPTIEQIGIILNDMPTHQTKMAWYNVMVQLKDSFELYQNQIAAGDNAINSILYPEIKTYAIVPRPAGDPPISQAQARAKAKAFNQGTANTMGEPVQDDKKPAIQMQEKSSNSYGGIIVALMMGAVAIFMIRRNKGTKDAAST